MMGLLSRVLTTTGVFNKTFRGFKKVGVIVREIQFLPSAGFVHSFLANLPRYADRRPVLPVVSVDVIAIEQ